MPRGASSSVGADHGRPEVEHAVAARDRGEAAKRPKRRRRRRRCASTPARWLRSLLMETPSPATSTWPPVALTSLNRFFPPPSPATSTVSPVSMVERASILIPGSRSRYTGLGQRHRRHSNPVRRGYPGRPARQSPARDAVQPFEISGATLRATGRPLEFSRTHHRAMVRRQHCHRHLARPSDRTLCGLQPRSCLRRLAPSPCAALLRALATVASCALKCARLLPPSTRLSHGPLGLRTARPSRSNRLTAALARRVLAARGNLPEMAGLYPPCSRRQAPRRKSPF